MAAVQPAASKPIEANSRIHLYSQRSPVLDWRANWFAISRGRDIARLSRARDTAFVSKLHLITEFGRKSGHKAGYDPAGAGSPWFSIGPRNVNGRVKSLAVHPGDPNTVYAGAAAGGVWKTTDGGQTWDALWDMQESLAVGAIAVSPSAPDTVYVGSGEWVPGYLPLASYNGAGVYVSTDAGVTWSRRPAAQSRKIGKLVVHPNDPQSLWICGDKGLERSTDGGVSWTTLSTRTVTDVALDSLNPQAVFMAVDSDGFYKSSDSGTTFSLLPGSPTGAAVVFPQIAIGKSGAHTNNFIVVKMAGTVQTSVDGGNTFTTSPGTHAGNIWSGWADVIAVAPDDENLMIWGSGNLEITTDGGNNWKSLPVHADQHAAVFAPSNSSIVYFANDGGVYRSDDKGATIRQISHGLVISQFYNINFWRSLSNVLGGGSQDTGVNLTTGGLSWTQMNLNFNGDGGWIVIDPTDPHTIYTECQNAHIEKSTDGGKTFTPKPLPSGVGTPPNNWEGVLIMDPNDHLRLFYGTDRVLRSTDGLATAWTVVSQVLSGSVTAIAIDPTNSSRIFAGTMAGKLYRSDDGGNTQPWADKSGILPSRLVSSIVASGHVVMVSISGISGAASSQSVFRSTDDGDTWNDVSGNLPNVVGNGIAVDPSDPNTWYLGTDTGVFRTTNAGSLWLAFDNGIPNVPCSGLVVDATSKILYCGTMGRGAYKLDITPGVTKLGVDLYVRDDDVDTGERFPSPSGLPDPSLPSPGTADFWMSPDIKVNHSPFFTTTGVFDGVDFDMNLTHQDPYRGQSNRFYVQVHNRGWQNANNVRVRAFIADASGGLPDLPNPLAPPNFDLTSTAAWTPVGPAKNVSVLKPNRPTVVFWDFVIPISEATHSCCLVVISSDEDRFNDTTTNIAQLVTQNKRVCLKNLHVVDPGPGGMPPTKQGIDFHNPAGSNRLLDIVIRPSGFFSGRIGLLLPKVTFSNSDDKGYGFTVVPLAPNDPVGKWYRRGDRKGEDLLERRFLACDRSHIFEFSTNTISELHGIEIPAGQTLKAVLVTTLNNDVYLTGPSRLGIVQLLDGKIAGGATFQYGYELPLPGTMPQCRRVRITADLIEWVRRVHVSGFHHSGEDSFILARTTISSSSDRISERLLHPKKGHEGRGERHHGRSSGGHDGHGHDEDRRVVKDAILFDGIVREGESLTVAILEVEVKTSQEKELYRRHFDGSLGIRSWLGEYKETGDESMTLEYGIDEIQDASTGGETD